ncbi:hypothetical protein QE412_002814 [Microbacterium trichothecenolyticum]|uniref:Uncharacterized protein n=1 Tax=Microbacterium trichothecenolyticum TaxID=69370 RepID=A0ABU0TX58_MICTR|nr:hypothetical protein [Microbacterium trichothecenolyticum]
MPQMTMDDLNQLPAVETVSESAAAWSCWSGICF